MPPQPASQPGGDGSGGRRPQPGGGGRSAFTLAASHVVLPWLLSVALGVLTALTGSYIALSCDFLGDLRFGFCQGILFADRNRCCGGSENVDVLNEGCAAAPWSSDAGATVRWVLWTEFFGIKRWAGISLACTMYVLSSVVLTGVAALLVHDYCPAAKGSGIPDVKAAVSGFDLPQSFSGSCLLVKTLGLSLAVGAGLSLGKEGPLIHIGVCWAHLLARLVWALGLPGSAMALHDFACAGAAAGVSTAFGAPLGGVLFAAEELGSVRALGRKTLLFAFAAAVSASFTLKHLNLSGANRLTLFSLSTPTHNPRKEWPAWEMAAFLVVGLVCGLVGVLFIKVNLWCTVERRRCQKQGRLWLLPEAPQRLLLRALPCLGASSGDAASGSPAPGLSPRALNVVEGVVIAIFTALLNWPLTTVLRSPSTEAIHALFETCPTSRATRFGLCSRDPGSSSPIADAKTSAILLLAAGLRVVQTSYTFGAKLPSGLFIPSLFIGATLGRFIGNIVYGLVEHEAQVGVGLRMRVEPGMFAMVGAVAMLSGFCRMTVSLVVIMFELTGELTYIVPFMCAALAAKLVGDPMSPSIYDGHAQLNGIAPIEEQQDIRLETVVGDLAVSLAPSRCIDATDPVPLRTLDYLASLELEAASAPLAAPPPAPGESFAAGSPPRRGRAAAVAAVVVARRGGVGSEAEILGVIEHARLCGWLARAGSGGGSGGGPPDISLVGRRWTSSTPAAGSASEARPSAGGSLLWLRQCSPPEWEGVCAESVTDASDLVDTRVARLSPYAPLLTAYCTFREKPKLQYCVCFDKHAADRLCILARADFEAALSEPRFPLARLTSLSLAGGGEPAAAAAGVVRRSSSGRRDHLELAPFAASTPTSPTSSPASPAAAEAAAAAAADDPALAAGPG